MKREVWTSKDLFFNCCGKNCCGEDRPVGVHMVPKHTKCHMVVPTNDEREYLAKKQNKAKKARDAQLRYFVVELAGRRRYLERSELLGKKEMAALAPQNTS